MKKKIFKCIIFIFILICILIFLSAFLRPKNNSVDFGMHYRGASGILAEQENTIDTIIIGNSEAYSSIIPMELWNDYGYTSYNCASPEQLLPLSLKMLKEVSKKQKPKVVILEANNLYNTFELGYAVDQMINYNIKAFQYHDRWKNIRKEDFGFKVNYDTVNVMKGYEYTREIQPLEKKNSEENKEARIPRYNQIYLKYLKKTCDKNNIKLIVIHVPNALYWSKEVHDSTQNFCDARGIEYLDINMHEEETKIDWTKDTGDKGDHVNFTGAKKTTKYIGKYLNEKQYLPSHKEDEIHNTWDKQYEKYRKIVE